MFSDNYPPYNFPNENGEFVGFNMDIFNAINHIYGDSIEFERGNWGEINKALEEGEIQAIAGAHYPGSPDGDFIYTRSTVNTSHCFFYNKPSRSQFSLDKFRTLNAPKVAMWSNIVLSNYILSINPTAELIYLRSYEQLVSALENGQVDCVFALRIPFLYHVKTFESKNIGALDHHILERNMGFKVSKANPELAKILNDGLEVILANGEYQRIYNKWFGEYEKEDDFWKNNWQYFVVGAVILGIILLSLVLLNQFLKQRIREKTADLEQQLSLNSSMMIELEKQKEKAEQSDKMKSAFLANMSHEIRTPMNSILGFTELLGSMDYSREKQNEFIKIIEKSGNRMLETINNIIEISRIGSGIIEIHYSSINVIKMMNDIEELFRIEAQNKGIKLLVVNQGKDAIENITSDEFKLNSILVNLIKNAIKFTDTGFVKVFFKISENSADFVIEDSGIGIPPEKQKNIFDEFIQANVSHSSGYEGSGLGLSIAKGFVDVLDGSIVFESIPEKGTTFKVNLPLQPSIKKHNL